MEMPLKRKKSARINQELLEAIKEGDLNQILILKEEGAELNTANPDDRDNKPIHLAAKLGHKHIVEFFISEGVNVQEKDKNGWTPLHYAAGGGKIDVVEYIKECGTNIYLGNTDDGMTSLHIAAANGHLNVAEYFLGRGMGIHEPDIDGWPVLHSPDFKSQSDISFFIDRSIAINAETNDGLRPLHVASENGHRDIVEMLLNKGATVNDINCTNNWTPLHYAATQSNLDVISFLIDKNADIHAQTKNSEKPIHIATKSSHKNVVQFFLSKGLGVDEVGKNGLTLLHYASAKGLLKIVKFLVENRANMHSISFRGKIPIHSAAANGKKNVVQFFLTKGINIDERTRKGWTPLIYAAHNNKLELVKFLLERGAGSGNETHVRITKPMHEAASRGQVNILKLYIEFGFDPNAFVSSNDTPLHMAAENGQMKAAEFLVEQGADVKLKNIEGEEPIHKAAQNGHIHVVEFFLGKNVDIDVTNNCGWTPLHCAIYHQRFELMKCLIDKGANIKARTNDGETPLSLAAKYHPIHLVYRGYDEVCNSDFISECFDPILDFLIDKGASVNDADNNGTVPLHYAALRAVGRNVCSMVEKLLHAGARPDMQDSKGKTPLHCAANHNHLYAVKKMLESKPNLNLKDDDGNTPLHVACKKQNKMIMKCLLEAGARSDTKDNNGRTVLYYYIVGNIPNIHYRDEMSVPYEDILGKIDNYIDIDDQDKKTAAHLVVVNYNRIHVLDLILKYQTDLNVEDKDGNTPLNYRTSFLSDINCSSVIRKLINHGAYFKKNDLRKIIQILPIRDNLLSDAKLCLKSIVNKFNNKDLPTFLGLPISGHLPPIERLKLTKGQVMRIEEAVEAEIMNNGFCDTSKMAFTSLAILSAESYVASFHSAISH